MLKHILDQFANTHPTEWLAFMFGILQVVLALKNKAVNFYAGIISVSLYCYVFYDYGLFAESMLNIYYLIISVFGLVYWKKKEMASVGSASKKDWVITALIILVGFIFLYVVLKKYTSSTVPYWDACVSAFAWAGSWLLMKRKIENWLVLNISNVLAIPLLVYKGLELTAVLTLVYIVVAILGYISWKKMLSSKQSLV